MVSMRTPSCSSPRPPISNESLLSLSENVIATLVSASARSRARITVEVTLLPSRPAKGESFTVMVTDMVGGSMGVEAIGLFVPGAQMVSATEASVSPAMQIMSPALTVSTGTRRGPSKHINLVKRPCSTTSPSKERAITGSFTRARPRSTRPIRHRPI